LNLSNLKAQFWSFDVIFAISIFGFSITILAYTWYNINTQLSIGYANNGGIMQLQLQTLSQQLLSPGSPENWYSGISVTNTLTWSGASVGLAQSQGSYAISPSRLYAFLSMSNYNYKATKQNLGVGYDYYIRVVSAPNIGAGLNLSIGKNPLTNNASTIYVNKVVGTLDGEPISITIDLWSNTTTVSG